MPIYFFAVVFSMFSVISCVFLRSHATAKPETKQTQIATTAATAAASVAATVAQTAAAQVVAEAETARPLERPSE